MGGQIAVALCFGLITAVLFMSIHGNGLEEDSIGPLVSLSPLLLILPFAYTIFCLNIKRLHDLDKSGWFLLLNLIPIVNWGLSIYLLFFKGTEGPNRFGADPLAATRTVTPSDSQNPKPPKPLA